MAVSRTFWRSRTVAVAVAATLVLILAVPAVAAPGGFLTAAPRYVLPSALGVSTTAILTVGDAVPEADASTDATDPGGLPQDGVYRMVGVPDGLGAFRNYGNDEDGGGGGTFTVLMNHELGPTFGVARDHGSTGAFVSRWVLRTSDFSVISGDDQIKTVYLAAAGGGWTGPGTFAFDRFCSADLPASTALYDAGSGLGTQELLYLNGEEARPPFGTRYGKAFAHIVTGPANGQTYELNDLGEMSFENVVASPLAQTKTVVVGLDDSTNRFTGGTPAADANNPPSEVYVYVGDKSDEGNPVERAGLVGGDLFGVRVSGRLNEDVIVDGDRFALQSMSEAAQDDGVVLQAESIAEGVTQFRRAEDGHWDPTSPNDFYFVTTDQFAGVTSVWRLRFDDVSDPELGGRIDRVYRASPGHTEAGAATEPEPQPGEMFDNMTVDAEGRILLQEDPGNTPHLARIWALNPDNGRIGELAIHNPALFLTAPVITLDEESSGIVDISHIVGRTTYLIDVQAHVRLADPELFEDGQFLAMTVKWQKMLDQSGARVFP